MKRLSRKTITEITKLNPRPGASLGEANRQESSADSSRLYGGKRMMTEPSM
mgnify:CR=1 FL=1